jgi:Fungal protein kinase
MPAHLHSNPVAALLRSWSPNLPNNASAFSVESYETSFDMDSAPDGPLINDHSSDGGPISHQLESVEVDVEGAEEITPENSQPASAALYEYPSSTPVKRRIASYRHFLPLGSPNILARDMGNYLAIELEKVAPIQILNLPSIVFPDSSLPFNIDETLLASLGRKVWNPRKNVLVPPAGLSEFQVEEWLNGIARAISRVTQQDTRKFWSSRFANSVLDHPELDRKPDIILINEGLNPISWRNVHAVAEVTTCEKLRSALKKTINNKTYLMFSTQYDRRFVPFLAICRNSIHFLVSDRQGQAITEIPYRQPGVYHALNLVRIIVALMFGSNETIGFDSTIKTQHDGEIKNISAGGVDYTIKSAIHAVRGIVGRSTRVWSASRMLEDDKKETVIIKDGWIQEGRANAEKENLEIMQKTTGIPTLVWGGTVQAHLPNLDNELGDDNTLWIRHMFSDRRTFRIHRRLVLKPVGENLSTFTSLGELIAALRDVAVGMLMTNFIYHAYILRQRTRPVVIKESCTETLVLTTFFLFVMKTSHHSSHVRAC